MIFTENIETGTIMHPSQTLLAAAEDLGRHKVSLLGVSDKVAEVFHRTEEARDNSRTVEAMGLAGASAEVEVVEMLEQADLEAIMDREAATDYQIWPMFTQRSTE